MPQTHSGIRIPRWPWDKKPTPEPPKDNHQVIEEIREELSQLDSRIQLLENRFSIMERE
jgi:hypothetical protein